MTPTGPGRFTRAALHADAGEAELRLSAAGNWQLYLRGSGEREWRLACSGDLEAGATVPQGALACEPVRIGDVVFDRAARRVCVDGAEVELSAREYEVFALLATQPERVFTKHELARELWGSEAIGASRTLESHVSRLRCALRHAGADGFVLNCHGVGYKLWQAAELPPAAAA